MRKKFSMLALIVLLVFQTMLTPIAATAQGGGTTETPVLKDGVFVDDQEESEGTEGGLSSTQAVEFVWTLNENVEIGKGYTANAPEDSTVEQKQDGELIYDEKLIGFFSVTEDGVASVEFNETIEGLPEGTTGAFEIDVTVETVVEEEQAKPDEESNEEVVAGEEEADRERADKDEKTTATEESTENETVTEEGNVADKTSENKETKVSKESSARIATKPVQLADSEKHGFKLELDEILDLDDEPFDEQHPMDPHEEFKLKLAWELEDGHNYVAGDTETFNLPKGIKIKQDIEIELKDESGQIIAHAIVKPDKTVELTFTDFVEGHSAVSGWMEIISELDIAEVEEEDGEIVIDPIGEEGELRIPIEKSNKDKTIEKNGQPNKGYNADEINWSVTINKNKTSLENARVIDELPEGTVYKEGSLKVTKLKVDLDGNVLGDGEEVEITPEVNSNGELIVPLGDTNDAYRVEYVTTVTGDEKKHFENNATLKDDELDDLSAKSTITINRGEPIKKSAVTNYDPKTGIIEWQIEFNYNQKDLSDITLTDAWKPEGMLELVEDSLKFQEVSIDENGNAHHEGDAINLPEGANLNVIVDGFEVTGISTDKAYKITYQTKVKDRVLDPEDVSNTAGFGSESDGSGTHIGQYYGAKSAGTIDYAEKTIEWTIRVNHDEYPMEKISIEDTLGEGLTLLEDTVNVTVGGEPYSDYTLSGDNPFTVDFREDYTTDKEIIITYKTEFDADNVPNNRPTNKAAITWTPEGEDDSITKEVETGTELNKETSDYSWKNGSYNPETKEITWEIITNYRENDFTNLIVQDEPQGNQQIIGGSAEVKELVIDSGGGISEGETVDDAATIDEENNTLTVNLGETNKAYKITYKTSLEGLDDMQNEYVNQAEVLDGNEVISEIDAKVGVVKNNKYGNKNGYQDGKQIHWSIDVNLVQQKIKDLKLVDSISENQEYLEDSIKVYHANIDGNGKTSKGEEVSSDEYELVVDQEAGEFTVKWKNEVERAFIVEYSTLFFEKHNGEVSNEYTITGDSIEEENSDASGSDNVTITQLGSGGGEGTAGYLVIDKVDSTHGQEETSLAGAEFDLIDADTGKVLKSGTTDENGQIDFGRLLFGDYQLKETKVPEGYVTPEEEQTITINQAYKPGDDKQSFAYTVENYVPVFAVELSKTDDEGNALAGAEFTLFDSDDNEIAKGTTNSEGKILFEDLKEAGTYYIQETKAPAGYVLDETKREVKIGEKEKEPVTVTAENKARGAVQLTKTDIDTGDVLAGVEFVLQKENDSGGYDTVSTHTTNDKGQIKTSNTLEAGNYQFVETEGLDGYRTNGKPIKFTVNVNSTETQELEMTNEQYKGSVKLIKKDAATDKELEGAEFKLVDSEGEVVEENLTTNTQGEIAIDDLFLGKYQLIETEAPDGYELDETPIDIEITSDNQVVEKTMTNNKITDIKVEKKWNNNGGDTAPVTVKLLPTGQTVELNEDNDWKATFTDLRVYDESGEEIDYRVEELEVDGYNSIVTGDSSDGFIVTNTETTSVSIEKTWKDDNSNDRPDQITVQLFADGVKVGQKEVIAANDWKYTFEDLDKYDEDGKEITYTIDEVEVNGYETNIDGFDITNVRIGTIAIQGEKTWQDVEATDRPDEITVELSREIDVEADKDFSDSKTVKPDNKGNWTYVFTDLAEFNDEGVAYTYTVKEANVPDNYKSEVNGHDITNTRIGKTEVSGTKRWKDDTVEDRPEEITINLLRNNVVVDTKEVTADDNWKYTFTDLDKYDDEGQLYKYSVKEQDVEGYNSEVKGTDITNTRAEKKDIEINKAWLDDNSEERPDSVVIYLKQNGQNFDTVELKADNDWTYTFTDLEAFDENGHAYSYSVEEKAVEGYETTIDGFDITNLRVGETEVSGTKTWLDDNSEDRPKEITVKLLANGEETDQTITVDADSDWTYEFTGLDQYDDQGKEITYAVDEEEVAGYEKSFNGNDITNLRVGKTEVTGEKDWVEVDERYRPDSITVQLLANGELEDTFEVSDETDWSYGFTGLEKYDDQGKEITYTVEEPDVPAGYDSKVDGYTITNTQESTQVTGEKAWEEVNSEYRPDSITVQLYANGEEETIVEVSSETNWRYEFTNLAKYDKDGEEITYTVDELDVPAGYDSEVDEYTITNTQISTSVSGEKTWNEVDDRYRPDSITVQLLANGEEEATIEVSAETDWAYAFTNLAQYDKSGKEITYTVKEVGIPTGYESEVDGFNITNTQEVTKVSGEKNWDEVDSQYRPDSITVQLLANGEEEETVEVSNETDWTYEFTDLAKYDKDGKEIDYTVEELDVPAGYKSEIDGYTITNTQASTEVKGEKIWKEVDSAYRPDSITVQLLANGKEAGTIEVTEETDWKYSFTDLAKYNKIGEEIEYTVEEVDGPANYNVKIDGYNITNTQKTYAIGDYTWIDRNKDGIQDDNEEVLEGVKVELFDKDGKKLAETETDGNGLYIFDELPAGDYKVKFTLTEKQKEKYKFTKQNAGDDTTVDSDADPVTGWTKEFRLDDDNEHLTKEYEDQKFKATEGIDPTWDAGVIELVHISGTKTWLDNDSTDRPEEITVYLVANGEETDNAVTVDADSDWQYAFNNLDKYDSQGEEITYTVNEKEVDGYEPIIQDFDITNLRVGKIEVEITKSWNDENETDRPETIIVNLLQNGDFYEEYEVTKENDWKLAIKDLPQYDEAGKAYEYTITEHDVAGYAADVDGFEITNTRTDKKTIEINKSWLDTEETADRPDAIEVNLFRSIADGDKELVETYTVTANDDWSLEITDLPSFNNDGKAYTYEVEEKAVAGYETTINGFDITNLRVGETEVEGTKTWLDDDSEDRPETITVQLFANGEETDKTAEVTAETEWKYEFTGLDKYDNQGIEITYTIDEVDVPEGYEKSIEDNDITNVRIGTTEVSGEKSWVEVDEQYRPDLITVNLLANGEESLSTTASAETDWNFTFTDLAKYDSEGKEIEYTIEEVEVPGYVSEVDGYNITNTQATTEITGTKTWKDDNVTDRPDSITVQVMNGADVVQEQEVTAEADWNFTFIDLAKYDTEGNEVEYTINELPVPGYATEIDGFDITNMRADVLDIAGTKTWKDDNAEDRPSSITVQLLANGEVVDSIEVTAETDWTYTFENVDAFDAEGVAIVYTVAEIEVDGYETSINGFDITNTLVPVEEPEDPEEPELGGDGGEKDPEDPTDLDGAGGEIGDGGGDNLPKTATNMYNLALIGFGLMLLGLILFIVRRKRIE